MAQARFKLILSQLFTTYHHIHSLELSSNDLFYYKEVAVSIIQQRIIKTFNFWNQYSTAKLKYLVTKGSNPIFGKFDWKEEVQMDTIVMPAVYHWNQQGLFTVLRHTRKLILDCANGMANLNYLLQIDHAQVSESWQPIRHLEELEIHSVDCLQLHHSYGIFLHNFPNLQRLLITCTHCDAGSTYFELKTLPTPLQPYQFTYSAPTQSLITHLWTFQIKPTTIY